MQFGLFPGLFEGDRGAPSNPAEEAPQRETGEWQTLSIDAAMARGQILLFSYDVLEALRN